LQERFGRPTPGRLDHRQTEVFVSSPTQSAPEEAGTDPSPGTVHVWRTVPSSAEHVWECLISREGTEALLGSGAFLGSKGEPWRSEEGPHGVVRSYHPLEQLRVSWHATDDDPPSLVDLHLVPDDAGTRLDLAHERLHDGDDPDGLRRRWEDALERLSSVVSA
jgi:protein Tex